ncbi:uncharacterized protein MEPE_01090 [Melanopsichium pennsylvanicum]|uniref:Proteasome assembly chaperone 3 n=2 Tax=Melanopsichium pennsylvanicum TaxID=63383 RepID=A0AAJ4XHB8_9BASI|nr:conserved hypothetical protein [Melanopsichium pennsylvanicum 4]SNX82384.1 uncharacterized protein MEPE_01090 [Melanopsichium pennsylvanicum]
MVPRPNVNFDTSSLKVEVTSLPRLVTPTRTITAVVNGTNTTVIAQSFADRIFITVTQLSKFGVLYQAITSTNPGFSSSSSSFDQYQPAASASLPSPLPSTSITRLVGTEPSPNHAALYQLYVSQIAAIIKIHASPHDARPLIVSLALKINPDSQSAPIAFQNDQDQHDEDRDQHDEDEDESLLLTSESERQRFIATMDLIQQCRVW